MSGSLTLTIGGSLELILRPPPPDIIPELTFRYGAGFSITAKGTAMATTLPVGQRIHVAVAYKDSGGNAATVDGPVGWDSSNDAIATVTVDPGDSKLATVAAGGTVGSAQISCTADADLGAGVRSLVTLLDVTTVPGEAVAGVISVVGNPEPIP